MQAREVWKVIDFDKKIGSHEHFKISNYGRVMNCKGVEERLQKISYINSYQSLPLKQVTGKSTSRYIHKLVAQHFIDNPEDKPYVIHLDYDKENNTVENLQWASKREKEVHQFTNPTYVNAPKRITYSKLNEGRVRIIKRKIFDPNRKTRLRLIAKQFGISEMQLHRIKTGENWGDVTDY